jgi:hypothetical protein
VQGALSPLPARKFIEGVYVQNHYHTLRRGKKMFFGRGFQQIRRQ